MAIFGVKLVSFGQIGGQNSLFLIKTGDFLVFSAEGQGVNGEWSMVNKKLPEFTIDHSLLTKKGIRRCPFPIWK